MIQHLYLEKICKIREKYGDLHELVTKFYLRLANYIVLQSVKPVIKVKYLLHDYFWSGAAMYVSLWLNTGAAIQMFFIERIFVFFHDTILKEDGDNIKCKQIQVSFQTH